MRLPLVRRPSSRPRPGADRDRLSDPNVPRGRGWNRLGYCNNAIHVVAVDAWRESPPVKATPAPIQVLTRPMREPAIRVSTWRVPVRTPTFGGRLTCPPDATPATLRFGRAASGGSNGGKGGNHETDTSRTSACGRPLRRDRCDACGREGVRHGQRRRTIERRRSPGRGSVGQKSISTPRRAGGAGAFFGQPVFGERRRHVLRGSVDFGDGFSSGGQWTVTAVDAVNDVISGELEEHHTYASNGPFTAPGSTRAVGSARPTGTSTMGTAA